jgi:hypothetical protein
MLHFLKVIFFTIESLAVLPALATAQTVLTVKTNEKAVHFTLEELVAMRHFKVSTTNNFVNEASLFEGPLLRGILQNLNVAPSANLEFLSLNNFSTNVPAIDAFEYDVILALYRDGKAMPVREKGPVWIIYPMDDNPQIQNEIYNDRLVWQLREINVQ